VKDGQGRPVVLFHLKRFWEGQVGSVYIKDLDLYEEIKAGRKTSEWRDNTEYWKKRLHVRRIEFPLLTYLLGGPTGKIIRAWFVCGYPKGNLPRLEATITEVLEVEDSDQLEIKFKDVVEVKVN